MPHTPFHRPTEFTRRKPPQPPAWMEEEMHGEKESPKIQVPSGPSDPYGGEVPQTPYRYQPPKIRVPSRPSDPYGGEVPQTPYQYQPREDSFSLQRSLPGDPATGYIVSPDKVVSPSWDVPLWTDEERDAARIYVPSHIGPDVAAEDTGLFDEIQDLFRDVAQQYQEGPAQALYRLMSGYHGPEGWFGDLTESLGVVDAGLLAQELYDRYSGENPNDPGMWNMTAGETAEFFGGFVGLTGVVGKGLGGAAKHGDELLKLLRQLRFMSGRAIGTVLLKQLTKAKEEVTHVAGVEIGKLSEVVIDGQKLGKEGVKEALEALARLEKAVVEEISTAFGGVVGQKKMSPHDGLAVKQLFRAVLSELEAKATGHPWWLYVMGGLTAAGAALGANQSAETLRERGGETGMDVVLDPEREAEFEVGPMGVPVPIGIPGLPTAEELEEEAAIAYTEKQNQNARDAGYGDPDNYLSTDRNKSIILPRQKKLATGEIVEVTEAVPEKWITWVEGGERKAEFEVGPMGIPVPRGDRGLEFAGYLPIDADAAAEINRHFGFNAGDEHYVDPNFTAAHFSELTDYEPPTVFAPEVVTMEEMGKADVADVHLRHLAESRPPWINPRYPPSRRWSGKAKSDLEEEFAQAIEDSNWGPEGRLDMGYDDIYLSEGETGGVSGTTTDTTADAPATEEVAGEHEEGRETAAEDVITEWPRDVYGHTERDMGASFELVGGFDVTGFWVPYVPTEVNPDSVFVATANALLPFLSQTDRMLMGNALWAFNDQSFPNYMDIPEPVGFEDYDQFFSVERFGNILLTLRGLMAELMAQADGDETVIGTGLMPMRWLISAVESLQRFVTGGITRMERARFMRMYESLMATAEGYGAEGLDQVLALLVNPYIDGKASFWAEKPNPAQ